MMFLAGVVRGTFRFCCASLFCDCAASPLLGAWPAANAAEVTASPERKSLRFMGPHFHGEGNAEGYQKQRRATSFYLEFQDSPRIHANQNELEIRNGFDSRSFALIRG